MARVMDEGLCVDFEAAVYEGDEPAQHAVAGSLIDCRERMPSYLCEVLQLPPGSTYAEGASRVLGA